MVAFFHSGRNNISAEMISLTGFRVLHPQRASSLGTWMFLCLFHSRNLILLLSALTMLWHHVLKLSQKNSLSPQPLLPYSALSSFPQPYPTLPFLLKFVMLGSSPLSPHFSMFGVAENNDTVWPNLGGRKGG